VDGSDDGGRSNPGDGSASGAIVIDFFARLRWIQSQRWPHTRGSN
jgi:hypothetical protein